MWSQQPQGGIAAIAILVIVFAGCESFTTGLDDLDPSAIDWDTPPVRPEDWSAEPMDPDPELVARIAKACLEPAHLVPEMEADADHLATGAMLFDQRSDGAAMTQWTTPAYNYTCFAVAQSPSSDAIDVLSRDFASAWDDPDRPMLQVEATGPWFGLSEATGVVDPSVALVEIELVNGEVLEATHGHGRFIAWWIGATEIESVSAFSADGTLVAHEERGAVRRLPLDETQ